MFKRLVIVVILFAVGMNAQAQNMKPKNLVEILVPDLDAIFFPPAAVKAYQEKMQAQADALAEAQAQAQTVVPGDSSVVPGEEGKGLAVPEMVVWSVDFANAPNGPAGQWLADQEFTLQNNAKKLAPVFQSGKLILEVGPGWLGMITKRIPPTQAKRVRIYWGMDQFPEGANWEVGEKKEGLGVALSFGSQPQESGTYFLPNLPYFLSIFFGQHEKPGVIYTGKYYKKTGRYLCGPCGQNVALGQEIVTDISFENIVIDEFKLMELPPVTSVSFEFDTRDLSGSKSYIRKIELLQ